MNMGATVPHLHHFVAVVLLFQVSIGNDGVESVGPCSVLLVLSIFPRMEVDIVTKESGADVLVWKPYP